MSSRQIRPRGQLPANWKFREGRPRWEPAPGLRQAGWRGRDLKDPRTGLWLSEGASIDHARTINEAVRAWRAGQLVPTPYADMAPAGARAGVGPSRAELADRRSIGALMDRYLASREFGGLVQGTQVGYRSSLSRLVDALAGWAKAPANGAPGAVIAAYHADRQSIRDASVDVLEPPEFGAAEEPVLKLAYWALHDAAGHHAAVHALRIASAWLQWCMDEDRSVRLNAAKLVKMKTPKGRIRVGTWEELAALVAAADTLGYPSIGDSVILGVDLSWSQSDRLALTWGQISAGRVRAVRQKTGRPGETPLLPTLGVARLAAIRRRQGQLYGQGNLHTHVIVCESTGKRWGPDHYRSTFGEVRAEAVKHCPTVATLRDQDLRDTAVTLAYEAGLTIPEICSRTLHSPVQAQKIIDAHYGAITRTVGDNAAAKLVKYLAKTKAKL